MSLLSSLVAAFRRWWDQRVEREYHKDEEYVQRDRERWQRTRRLEAEEALMQRRGRA